MKYEELKDYIFAQGRITSGYSTSPHINVKFALHPQSQKIQILYEYPDYCGYCTYAPTYDFTYAEVAEAYDALRKVDSKYLTELARI